MLFLRLLFILTVCALSPHAQEIGDETPREEVAPPQRAATRKREALSRILVRKAELEKEITTIREELVNSDQPRTEFEHAAAAKKIAELQVIIDGLDSEFSKVSSGLDPASLQDIETGNIRIEDEIREIFKPVIQEFRGITAAPRKSEELRTDIGDLKRKLLIVEEARENLKDSISKNNPTALQEALAAEVGKLQETRLELETQLGIAQAKLEDLQEDSPTFLESVSTFVKDFFRSRGAHLLMAIAVAFLTVLLIRFAYRIFLKVGPKKLSRGENFTSRLIHLCYSAISILGGVLAFILTLYLANDWLLLAFALLFLFGVAWTGKNTLPQFFEQGKMLLNLGTVRQNERLIYEGIPWKVQKVNFYTSLINPALEGGKIRLPVRDLMKLHSRPNGEDELWFPCHEGDWVMLSDETFGKVLQQTPDYVHIVKLGGTRKVIPTGEFLSLHPANFSKNFRLQVPFGIDYSHQKIATSEVPQILEVSVKRALIEKVDKEALLSVKVFFTSAAASSLDYRIVVDLAGELAPRHNALRDIITSTCVEACNQHGWIIPFTQITIHKAELASEWSAPEPIKKLP